MQLRKIFFTLLIAVPSTVMSQKIDSIYVNLYTDSLKKGSYNYINIDGKLSNGSYIPLDSTHIIFWSAEGKFYGNSLWLAKDFKHQKVHIKIILRANPQLSKEFTMYIKKKPDDEKLPTTEELLKEMEYKSKRNKRKA